MTKIKYQIYLLSKFLNLSPFCRLTNEDSESAEVGETETTTKPTEYPHPDNPKIVFVDLPGIGTPKNRDLEPYCEKTELEKYDVFLIFAIKRFIENDLKLARKIGEIGKKFLVVRTNIDVDVGSGRRGKPKSFDEDAMLEKVRCDIAKNLGDLLSKKEDIFLISNYDCDKWDYDRLTQAIIQGLPTYQREALTLSLTRLSEKMVESKVEVLNERIWKVAAVSAAAATVPIPALSVAVDIKLIIDEVSFYRSQLCLPPVESRRFLELNVYTQECIRGLCFQNASQVAAFLAPYATEAGVEEVIRFVPVIGQVLAGGLSFAATYGALKYCLHRVKGVALAALKDTVQNAAKELEK